MGVKDLTKEMRFKQRLERVLAIGSVKCLISTEGGQVVLWSIMGLVLRRDQNYKLENHQH
jgi:hypothetical protein